MRVLGRIIRFAVIGTVVSGLVALGLIVSEWPDVDPRAAGGGIGFDELLATTGGGESTPLQHYTARDGSDLGYRRWEAGEDGVPLLVMVHGSGWHGAQFERLGAFLAGEGLADVVAPDLRGHGPAPARRGDVDYIGQMEDDLADLIAHAARPGQGVVMLGHSSGGGLVIRLAGGAHGGRIERAILLAPYVQHDAPTRRPDAGGWATPLIRRIIGLTMLNSVGITALNHLTVIQFNFPDAVLAGPGGAAATRAYTFRLNAGYGPRRDWRADVAALPDFLLVAGRQDAAFDAVAYEPTFSAITGRGRYELIEAGHLDVVEAAEAHALIAGFLRAE